jgi:hypothetical protein
MILLAAGVHDLRLHALHSCLWLPQAQMVAAEFLLLLRLTHFLVLQQGERRPQAGSSSPTISRLYRVDIP